MRKQYRYEQLTFGKYGLYLFHDGKMIESKELWLDEFFDMIEDIEKDGYTYGYFQREVDEAKKRYDHVLSNVINEV